MSQRRHALGLQLLHLPWPGAFLEGPLGPGAGELPGGAPGWSPRACWPGDDWAGLFLCQGYMGDKDAALAALEERRKGLPRPGRANTVGAWGCSSRRSKGWPSSVNERRPRSSTPWSWRPSIPAPSCLVVRSFRPWPASRRRAGGQWEKAEEHYQTALRQAHEIPIVIEQPEVRRWYARMLIDRDAPGDREQGPRAAHGSHRHVPPDRHAQARGDGGGDGRRPIAPSSPGLLEKRPLCHSCHSERSEESGSQRPFASLRVTGLEGLSTDSPATPNGAGHDYVKLLP